MEKAENIMAKLTLDLLQHAQALEVGYSVSDQQFEVTPLPTPFGEDDRFSDFELKLARISGLSDLTFLTNPSLRLTEKIKTSNLLV